MVCQNVLAIIMYPHSSTWTCCSIVQYTCSACLQDVRSCPTINCYALTYWKDKSNVLYLSLYRSIPKCQMFNCHFMLHITNFNKVGFILLYTVSWIIIKHLFHRRQYITYIFKNIKCDRICENPPVMHIQFFDFHTE